MKKMEEALKAMLDREAIRDLPARYCDLVWRNDIEGLVKLFTPDGEFAIVTPEQTMRAQGQTELLDFYARGLAITPRPFIHNVVVELGKKGRATGRCYLDLRSAKRDMAWLGAGYYHDEYEKHRGVWKFARREFFALRMEDMPAEAAPSPTPKAAPRAKKAKAAKA